MIYLRDYRPPEFQILHTRLFFDLRDDHVVVRSELEMERREAGAQLRLDGEELVLQEVRLNGKALAAGEYELAADHLTIPSVPDRFTLSTTVKLEPRKNTALSGLYASGEFLLTQCEAQGFRRVTYYLDRPDVMSLFTVQIEADKKKYPVLLSNGDLIETRDLEGGRHLALWKDPFKKPCYLFALVAGDLDRLEDEFTTRSGKKVKLEIYADSSQIPRCHYAMGSLKRAMRWDEERFGLEYDLSRYMIVTTDDFNAGAMENKGLNIFNSRLVLADPTSANDDNYFSIEAVIGHEYFHNWTGNRVTLRDWFHLSLKEGLTVFRDQEFSMDQVDRDLVRIVNVNLLRNYQFPEDQGPNAHPIRPESCESVDNFFTSTIYDKGAEVIRMMQTMVGRQGFRRGMDLYFQRHDGQAVIIEDFAKAIADANNASWDQFKLWYSQAGTPRVRVQESFDSKTGEYRAEFKQSCPPTSGQPEKKPFHIPLMLGLVGEDGRDLEVSDPAIQVNTEGQKIYHLTSPAQTLKVTGLKHRPVLSLNRQFSAPVEIDWSRPEGDLLFLFEKDRDCFNRWEAGQKLLIQELHRFIDALNQGQRPAIDETLASAMRNILTDRSMDPALRARMVEPPAMSYLAQSSSVFDPLFFEKGLHQYLQAYGLKLAPVCAEMYHELHGRYDSDIDARARGTRELKNWCLKMLCWSGEGIDLAKRQFENSRLMTDRESALALLAQLTDKEGMAALDAFYQEWKENALVLNKWWKVQASLRRPDTFERVKRLREHPAFREKNPNCVYSLLGTFGDNLSQFHRNKGECYEYYAQQIGHLDSFNPQVAARLASAFDFCLRTDLATRERARQALERLLEKTLSKNTHELISKTVKALTPPSSREPGSADHEPAKS